VTEESRPPAVTTAVRVLYAALTIEFAAAATWIANGAGMSLPLPLTVFFLPTLFQQFGLPALLVHGISTRKNWARVILAIWVAVSLPFTFPFWLAQAQQHPALVSGDVVINLAEMYAFYLLFTRASNQWFKSVRAA
jgi:hypothetical protein